MAPFRDSELDVGEFTYDAALPALRATVYGVESGSIDLLITADQTYRLAGPTRAPTGCTALGALFKPPSRQWTSADATCIGIAPVMSRQAEWWKMSAQNSASTYYWFATGRRLPLRAMLSIPAREPAVVGDYALTYFPTFEPLARTDLDKVEAFCRAQASGGIATASAGVSSARELMARFHDDAGDAEREARVAELVPGLRHDACAAAPTIRWPSRFTASAIMTAAGVEFDPFPAEVSYDWDGAKSMLTRLHDPDNPSSRAAIDSLLQRHGGYDIRRHVSEPPSCRRAYPGVIRPDWTTFDRCRCRGVLPAYPSAGRNEAMQILSCPIEPTSVFWAFYTLTGRPIVFRSTSYNISGLTLADYYDWRPGADIAPNTLDVPRECTNEPMAPIVAPRPDAACSGCHATPDR